MLLFSPPPPFATRKKADGYNPVINYEINVKIPLFSSFHCCCCCHIMMALIMKFSNLFIHFRSLNFFHLLMIKSFMRKFLKSEILAKFSCAKAQHFMQKIHSLMN